jgi:hypothetical protein
VNAPMKRQNRAALAYVHAMQTGRLVWTHGFKGHFAEYAPGLRHLVVTEQREGETVLRKLVYVNPHAYCSEEARDVRKLTSKVEHVISILDGFMKLGHLTRLKASSVGHCGYGLTGCISEGCTCPCGRCMYTRRKEP